MPANVPEVITDPSLAEEVVSAYREHPSVLAVAQRLGVGRRAVERLLDDRGIEWRGRGKKPPRGVVDPDVIERAIAEYQRGLSLRDAAKSAGISAPTIARHLDARGIPQRERTTAERKPREPKINPEAVERAIAEYQRGLSLLDAAKSAGISAPTLARRLEDRRIPRRRAGGRVEKEIDAEVQNEIVAMYEKRKSVAATAKAFNTSADKVNAILDERSIDRRRRPLRTEVTEGMRDEIVSAYKECGSVETVAKRFHVGERKVLAVLDERQVPRGRWK
jgi:transposase